jgi:hypothetical protein
MYDICVAELFMLVMLWLCWPLYAGTLVMVALSFQGLNPELFEGTSTVRFG